MICKKTKIKIWHFCLNNIFSKQLSFKIIFRNKFIFIFINRKTILDNLTKILNDMKNRIDMIKNFYPDEKFEDLDNKKLLNNINSVFCRAKEEFNVLNKKINDKLKSNKIKIFSNVESSRPDLNKPFDEASKNYSLGKQQIQQKIDAGIVNKKSSFGMNSMYNEALREREKEFKAIYE